MTAERRPGAAVPPTHAALLDAPLNAVLTTHLPTGRLHSSVVWFWRDGACVYVSTMAEFRKARNMRARPRATLLVTESGGPGRWVELRADVVPVPAELVVQTDVWATARAEAAERTTHNIITGVIAGLLFVGLNLAAITVVRRGRG